MKFAAKEIILTVATLCIAVTRPCDADVSKTHSIVLPHFEPEMPMAPGRDEFMVACVSCHSPRYITMQPAFPRKQWEATVSKMAKTFGAPIDEEQQRVIVDYLEAIKSGSPKAMAPGDGASDFLPAAPASHHVETFPAIKPATNADELAGDLKRGAELYAQDCAACHGATGGGDGVIAQSLLRRPADLALTRFSAEFLGQVLWNGIRGTAMPSWRNLKQSDVRAVSSFVQSLHANAKTGEVSTVPTERARSLFQLNCAPCHGPEGDGKSALAATFAPHPANFKRMQPDASLILEVLRDGIPGTAMPSWNEKLSEVDRAALADFVRSLYQPEAPDGK